MAEMPEILLFCVLFLLVYYFVFRFFELGKFNQLRNQDKSLWVPGVTAPFFILSLYLYSSIQSPVFHLFLITIYLFGFLDDTRQLDVYAKFFYLILVSAGFVFADFNHGWYLVPILFFYLNAYNFIDGINGFLTGALLVHLLFIYLVQPNDVLFAIIVLCALIFVVNLVGSLRYIPGNAGAYAGGFLLFYLDYQMAQSLHSVIPFFFSALYFTDVILTLAIRFFRKEPLLQAHRQHFYQKMEASGLPHVLISFIWMLFQSLFNYILIQFI